jgi:hypothetical protein
MRDDAARVVDIWLACRDIEGFVSGVPRDRYLQDRQLQMEVLFWMWVLLV